MKYLISVMLMVFTIGAQSANFRIMSYNVENLFDTEHDNGKEDFEYLPKNHPAKIQHCNTQPDYKRASCLAKDWNESRLELKLSQIKKVIDLVPGRKPDFLGLVEVENEAVVSRLAKKLGYDKWVISNSPDERGIDVALLYNDVSGLSFAGSKFHRIDPKLSGRPTRDILQAEFIVAGSKQKLNIFVNHWPSQGGPVSARFNAAKVLAAAVKERVQAGEHVFVMGDFNVVDLTDQPSPFLPLMGSVESPLLTDVVLQQKLKAKELKLDLSQMSIGTYFFGPPGKGQYQADMTWNMLDRFFVSQSLLSNQNLRVDVSSFKIFTHPSFSTTHKYSDGRYRGTEITNTPWSYNHDTDKESEAGFSDHFPIYVDLNL